MTIYLKSMLAGFVAMVLGFVVYLIVVLTVMQFVVARQMRAAVGDGGELASVSVSWPNYYLPFGAIVVFALGFLWKFSREKRRSSSVA